MNASAQLPRGPRILRWISICLFAGVCLYYVYVAVDTMGLSNHAGVATVLDKAYYAPGTSYQTLRIGNKSFIRPFKTAEAYVLKLRLDNQETPGVVDKNLFDAVTTNAEVHVVYQITRITKTPRVVQVTADVQKGGN